MALQKRSIAPGQLPLFSDLEDSSTPAVHPEPQPVIQDQTAQPMTRKDEPPRPLSSKPMKLEEMVKIRTWLWEYGKTHGYPEVSFPIGNGTMGDYRAGMIQAGEAHWSHVLRHEDMEWVTKAVQWIQSGNEPGEKCVATPFEQVLLRDENVAWLRQWSQGRGFPRLTFPVYPDADFKREVLITIEQGERHWSSFLAGDEEGRFILDDYFERARLAAGAFDIQKGLR